jgi:hypothetical protein
MKSTTRLYTSLRKNFSKITSEKERRLNQFFKLPKTKMEFQDKILDHNNDEEDISALRSYEEDQIDRLDMMDKIIKKKKLDSTSKMNKFFSNNSPMETVKITENLVERLRMNKEFRFTQEYKQKEILNEYGNYDKYFQNYRVTKEKDYDSADDGESEWSRKYTELQEKFKNTSGQDSLNKTYKNVEEKIKEDISNYGSDYTFNDYLAEKRRDAQFKVTRGGTNPRTPEDEYEEELE